MDTATATLNPFDEINYQRRSYESTHPNRLSAIGRMFGMAAASVTDSRVLEIGCASGDNLIPMAADYPTSSFVGVDSSESQVENAAHDIKALGLRNITVRQQSIMDLDQSEGQFDYIICHGVYSWVGRETQEAILRICHNHLSSQGIALVSYNTLPGWRSKQILRDIAIFHSRNEERLSDKIERARAALRFLAGSVKSTSPHGNLTLPHIARAIGSDDNYFGHEFLCEHNHPYHFFEFHEQLERAELEYLGESRLNQFFGPALHSMLGNRLKNMSLVEELQYFDFIANTMFRSSLVCRPEVTPQRTIDMSVLPDLHYVLREKPIRWDAALREHQDEIRQHFEPSSIAARDLIAQAALRLLYERWPHSIVGEDLLRGALQALPTSEPSADQASRFYRWLRSKLSLGQLIAATVPNVFATELGPKPRAYPRARIQARRTRLVSNHLHSTLRLNKLEQLLLPLLDGTRTLEDISSLLVKRGTHPIPDEHRSTEQSRSIVEAVAKGLLAKALISD